MKYDIPDYITIGWVVPLTPDVCGCLDKMFNIGISSSLRMRKYTNVKLMSFEIHPWQNQFKFVFYNVEVDISDFEKLGFFRNPDNIAVLVNDIPLEIRHAMIRIPQMICTQHYYDGGAKAEELKRQMLTYVQL